MIQGSCHRGAVAWQFEGMPGGATACNCTGVRPHEMGAVLQTIGYDDCQHRMLPRTSQQ